MIELKPEFQQISPPRIPTYETPDEADIINSISNNLRDMSTACHSLVCAVSLFETLIAEQSGEVRNQWSFMAARDGAMSIRNYATALAVIRGLVGRAPTLAKKTDSLLLKRLENEFNEYFPFAHKMRHAVAHPELFSNPEKKMGVTGDFQAFGIRAINCGEVAVRSGLYNSTFNSTFEGAFVHYDLTAATCSIVINITKKAFSAFPQD